MLKVFIGWDKREVEAYHVLAHSIITRASSPVAIIPVKRDHLIGTYTRERGLYESTDFSLTRFLVPYLSGYEGYSIFMDCDMLCLDNIYKVFTHINKHDCVSVCKHDYTPKSSVKMDGQTQTKYPRKNWSSFMVFNNTKCRVLTPQLINTESGLDLHYFSRLPAIGSLPLEWNWLVGEYESNPNAKVLHYTLGGPWMKGYEQCDHAEAWLNERKEIR